MIKSFDEFCSGQLSEGFSIQGNMAGPITESIDYMRMDYVGFKKYIDALRDIQQIAKSLGNRPLLYRGGSFREEYRSSDIMLIGNVKGEGGKGRQRYQGGQGTNPNQDAIMAGIYDRFGWDTDRLPIFVTPDASQTTTFGKTFAFIPKGDTEYVQSPKIRDISVNTQDVNTEAEQKAIIDSYREGFPRIADREAIVYAKEYYLIDIDPKRGIIDLLPRKWQQQFSNMTKYSQIADLMGKEIWLAGKAKEARIAAGMTVKP